MSDTKPVGSPRFITENELRQKADEWKKKTKSKLINYFIENPNPSDEQIHEFARQCNSPVALLEKLIYEMFTDCITSFNTLNMSNTNDSIEYSEKANMELHTDDSVDLFIDSLYDNLKKIDSEIIYEVKHGNPTIINFSSNVPSFNFYYHKQLDNASKFSGLKPNLFSAKRRGNKYVVTVKNVH